MASVDSEVVKGINPGLENEAMVNNHVETVEERVEAAEAEEMD